MDPRIVTLSPAEVAEVWLRSYRHDADQDSWAEDALFAMLRNDPERAWLIILALLERAEERDLGLIGAGPLAGLVWAHDAVFIERIEAAAATSVKFRRAMGSITVNLLEHAPEIVTRLVRASGGAIVPFVRVQTESDYPKRLDGA